MIHGKRILTLCLLCLPLVAGAAEQRRPMSIDDELRMTRLDGVAMSPDGALVLYGTRDVDWENNDYVSRHYLYRVNEGSTQEFIGDGGGEDFQFSPDGKRIAFIRSAGDGDGEAQLFTISANGGEAQQLTTHPGGIGYFKWHSTSDGLVYVADDRMSEDEEREWELGRDAYFVDEAPNGKRAARFSNFWEVDLSTKSTRQLSEHELLIGDFDISPDGQHIVFDARPDNRTNYPGDAELYLLSIEDGSRRRLTDNNAPESNAMWSPDGRLIAYRAPDDREFELRNGAFWVLNPISGERRKLHGQHTGEMSTQPVWSADSRHVLYSEIHGTNTNLYRIDVKSGDAEAMTAVTGSLRGHAFSADSGSMVYSFQDFTHPADLYISDINGRDARRITDLNPWVRDELALSEGQLLQWTSKGGMTIEGVFYAPVAGSTEAAPMIVNVHGGPAGVIENGFRADFQRFAGQGFAILAPNFRGSTGYRDELLRGLMGEVGDGEYLDVMHGVDHAIANRQVDPDRLALRGWSWGGVSTSYIVTQTDRFKAASIGAMVGNWAAETGPGFNFDVSLWYIGGTPWDNPDEWRKRSSISHVKNVTTPSILFHGGQDSTSSVGQSLMFYTALRAIGKAPVRYMNFPREGHGIREPRHRRQLDVEELRWFHRHVNDREWNPPAVSLGAASED